MRAEATQDAKLWQRFDEAKGELQREAGSAKPGEKLFVSNPNVGKTASGDTVMRFTIGVFSKAKWWKFINDQDPTPDPIPPSNVPLFQHLHDYDLLGFGRSLDGNFQSKGTPEVFPLLREVTKLTKQWQFYTTAINSMMQLKHIASLFADARAFCNNGHGFPGPANFILGENLDAELPKFTAVWTCGGSVMTGQIQNGYLHATFMDGNKEPPLKAGRQYPQTIADINLDDYLYNPQEHPYMFFAANISWPSGDVTPFPNGGFYPWTRDNQPYSWLPHVSRYPVLVKASHLRQVSAWTPPYLNV